MNEVCRVQSTALQTLIQTVGLGLIDNIIMTCLFGEWDNNSVKCIDLPKGYLGYCT